MDGPFLLGTEAVCLYARFSSIFHMDGTRVTAAVDRGTGLSGRRGGTLCRV
jgi:hypothetical protein